MSGNDVKGRTIESTKISRIKVVSADTCDCAGRLSLGHLLKWLDATSCMAAERLAKRCCVTLLMDDLIFAKDVEVRQGHRVYLDASVTRAWGSSCEVQVTASVSSHPGQTPKKFANVHFLYVILKTKKEKEDKIKVKLPQLNTKSMDFYQLKSFENAEKRKKFRRHRTQLVSELAKTHTPTGPSPVPIKLNSGQSIRVESATSPALMSRGAEKQQPLVDMWELVLPLHANHMGNTFGGQIMCWMAKAANEAAWNYVGFDKDHNFVPVCIDQVLFLAPSHVGDRLSFVATVTRVFQTSLEVKVSVFGGDVSKTSDMQLINEAFVTYVFAKRPGTRWNAVKIPRRIADTSRKCDKDDDESLALGRRLLRLKRVAMDQLLSTFKELDESRDGMLSKDELSHALKSDNVLNRCMSRLGIDGTDLIFSLIRELPDDKSIDFETFQAAVGEPKLLSMLPVMVKFDG